jgi:ribonuclease P protein component
MPAPLVMLRRPADFSAVQRGGVGRANGLLAVRFVRNGLGQTRFGFSTGRKLGSAVTRNRVRRRLRVAVRNLVPGLERGWDVLIVARPESARASFMQLLDALEGLFRRAGLLKGEGCAR